MKTLAVIPARYASQRFPGKPLADLAGKPMIWWVHRAVMESQVFDEVIVATEDQRIADVVNDFGGQAAMTDPNHATGTDRVAEVAKSSDAQVVANVQGDLPTVTSEALKKLIEPFARASSTVMSTLACPLPENGVEDLNTVKVVCDQQGNALYFSRSPIPHFRTPGPAPVYQHLGLYAFSRQFLFEYATWPSTPLEQRESLEQLRVLENGYRIALGLIDRPLGEVNTPSDLVQLTPTFAKAA